MFDLIHLFSIRSKFDRSKSIYAIAFAFLLVTLGCRTVELGSPASAQTPPREVLRVATSGDYSPFSDWPIDAPMPLGFSISVAQAYVDDAGVALEWVRFRWPTLATDLTAHSFDLALSGITVRPDRSMLGRFSLPLTTSGAVILVPARSSFESASDLDRPSIRIVVNAGGHLERVARRLFPSSHIEAIPNNAGVLRRLDRGEVDAALTDTLEATHWRRRATTPLRAIGPLTRDLKAAWFPPENEAEAFRFNRWLLRAESTGQLDRLRQEHGLPEGRTALALPALLSSLDERLTLMRAVADAKHVLEVPIENPAREEVVLDAAIRGIEDAADEVGTTPPDRSAVRRFFRAQIEAAKWIQNQRLLELPAKRRRVGGAGRPSPKERLAARTTLNEVIRPALIYLGNRISMLVIAWVTESSTDLGHDRGLAYDDVSFALERHNLPESNLRAIYEALSEITRREKDSETPHRPARARKDKVPNG